MQARRFAVLAVMILCLGGSALAQDDELPLSNWSAPPYWSPTEPRTEVEPGDRMFALVQGMQAQAEALPSSPLPFVAIAPCRIVDTRQPASDGFHQPNFADGEARTFPFPSSPDCTGLPATVGAWSLNIQFRPMSQLAYLTAYPTGITRPGVSTLSAGPAAWVQNAAVVPAGTSGAIDIYCQYAGRVVIDINGYYGPQSVVTSLTGGASTLTGDVTLGQGSNVTITPSGNTLTIAATGGPGGVLPIGSSGQTLRNNGAAWAASSTLTNDGTNVGIANNLVLPTTTATTGQILIGPSPFLHAYGTGNTFLGVAAGNLLATSCCNTGSGASSLSSIAGGAYNTANGYQALVQNTDGLLNTAVGAGSLSANTTASRNVAIGYHALHTQSFDSGGYWESKNVAVGVEALYSNQPTSMTNGLWNVAIGDRSLYSNTTGGYNTAAGTNTLFYNTSGLGNTAVGFHALTSNTTGYENTACGINSLLNNTTGHDNTAIGSSAGSGNQTGSYNVFLGNGAGQNETGSSTLYIAGAGTKALIYGSFSANQLGINIDTTSSGPALGATLDVNGQIRARTWTGSSLTSVCRDANGVLVPCDPSDARLKTAVVALTEEKDVMAILASLRGVAFNWDTSNSRVTNAGPGRQIGFIAQEVEAVLPEVVHVEPDGYRSVDYAKLTAFLVEVAKAQQARIDAQQTEIESLRVALGDLSNLKVAVEELRRQARMPRE